MDVLTMRKFGEVCHVFHSEYKKGWNEICAINSWGPYSRKPWFIFRPIVDVLQKEKRWFFQGERWDLASYARLEAEFFLNGGEEVLIKNIGQVILIYSMGVSRLPSTLCKDITHIFARFWLGSSGTKRKIYW